LVLPDLRLRLHQLLVEVGCFDAQQQLALAHVAADIHQSLGHITGGARIDVSGVERLGLPRQRKVDRRVLDLRGGNAYLGHEILLLAAGFGSRFVGAPMTERAPGQQQRQRNADIQHHPLARRRRHLFLPAVRMRLLIRNHIMARRRDDGVVAGDHA
jgi:hypothetical protein